MLSSVFGDISRFAVEVRDDLERSVTCLFGLFFYWIDGRRIGTADYFDLTDVFSSMRWVNHDCGRRDGGRLCELPPSTVCRWWHTIMADEDPATLGIETDDLPTDVLRFSLWFHTTIGPDAILLLSCGGRGKLILASQERQEPLVIEDDIQRFEEPLRQSYQFLDSLHEKLGI